MTIGETHSNKRTTRKPLLLLRFEGELLLRLAARKFTVVLLNPPPRKTRKEPAFSDPSPSAKHPAIDRARQRVQRHA